MAESYSQFGPSVQRDETLRAWLAAAARAAAAIWRDKEARLMEWIDDAGERDPRELIKRLRELPRVLFDEDLVELDHQATLAAMLRGMTAAAGAVSQTENSAYGLQLIANSSPLFDKLPFKEAIDGLAERLGLIKWSRTSQGQDQTGERRGERRPAFMELDAANRSRAFTMAWVQDLDYLQQIHDELVETINNGETLYDWRMKHIEAVKERGWEGSPLGEGHYELVYRQNLSMAYSAGRYQQGARSGFRVVRILPTLSQSPRPDHAQYAGQMFRIDEQSSLPPWDFGCNCGWEWVFTEELDGVDVDALPLLRFDDRGQEFKWRPAAYMALKIRPGQYEGAVRDIAEDMA